MSTGHECMLEFPFSDQIHAATEVSGYGMAYACDRMADGAGLYAQVDPEKLCFYPGVLAAIEAGVRASLHVQNRMPFDKSLQGLQKNSVQKAEACFDPQTAGGILLSVSADKSAEIVDWFQKHGLASAKVVGKMVSSGRSRMSFVAGS